MNQSQYFPLIYLSIYLLSSSFQYLTKILSLFLGYLNQNDIYSFTNI